MYIEFFAATTDEKYKKCLYCINKNNKYNLSGGDVFFAILPDNTYCSLIELEPIKNDIYEICSEFEIDGDAYNFDRIYSLLRNKKIDEIIN